MNSNYNYNSGNIGGNMIVAIAPPPPLGEINTLPPWILWITIAVGLAIIAVIALVYRYKRQF